LDAIRFWEVREWLSNWRLLKKRAQLHWVSEVELILDKYKQKLNSRYNFSFRRRKISFDVVSRLENRGIRVPFLAKARLFFFLHNSQAEFLVSTKTPCSVDAVDALLKGNEAGLRSWPLIFIKIPRLKRQGNTPSLSLRVHGVVLN
jgi:hypothetical protein